MYFEGKFVEYLYDLAAKKPAPGGGSAAAAVGALGISLLSMVANFTVGKEKYRDVEQQMQQILSSSEGTSDSLIILYVLSGLAILGLTSLNYLSKQWRRTYSS